MHQWWHESPSKRFMVNLSERYKNELNTIRARELKKEKAKEQQKKSNKDDKANQKKDINIHGSPHSHQFRRHRSQQRDRQNAKLKEAKTRNANTIDKAARKALKQASGLVYSKYDNDLRTRITKTPSCVSSYVHSSYNSGASEIGGLKFKEGLIRNPHVAKRHGEIVKRVEELVEKQDGQAAGDSSSASELEMGDRMSKFYGEKCCDGLLEDRISKFYGEKCCDGLLKYSCYCILLNPSQYHVCIVCGNLMGIANVITIRILSG
jgi:hypothetical protein